MHYNYHINKTTLPRLVTKVAWAHLTSQSHTETEAGLSVKILISDPQRC